MMIFETIALLRKCLGEARWSRYQSFTDKLEVFKVLFRLRYYVEIKKGNRSQVTQRIFKYRVSGFSYFELLYLFREIFLEKQYKVDLPKDNPLIVDCGANIGMSVLFFKRLYPKSQILAFEPNPIAFDFLKRNIETNKIEGVELINASLSDKEGEITFYIDPENSLISSIDKNRTGKTEISVTSTKLSKYLVGRDIDFAKIDIEGAEWGVANDLHRSGTMSNIKNFIFEYHHNINGVQNTMAEFLNLFEQNGFSYNLNASFSTVGQFQDIGIYFYKKN